MILKKKKLKIVKSKAKINHPSTILKIDAALFDLQT